MDTYAVRGATRKMTGHYRRPGTRDLYCGRPAGTKNTQGATLRGWKMCTACVKAEAADRSAAEAVAAEHRETIKDHAAHTSADRYIAREFPAVADLLDIEARHAAELVTEAEATDGTWRGEWIGERTTATAPALFDLPTEQGALFA